MKYRIIVKRNVPQLYIFWGDFRSRVNLKTRKTNKRKTRGTCILFILHRFYFLQPLQERNREVAVYNFILFMHVIDYCCE